MTLQRIQMAQPYFTCKFFILENFSAASWGYYDLVTDLILAKGSISITNQKGFTPLDYAYNEDMKNHLLYCVECIKNNHTIITPKRINQENFGGSEVKENTGMAYVSYLKSIF